MPEKEKLPKGHELSDLEICQLRIKCLEPFIITASRHGLEKGEVFELGERAWKFCVAGLSIRVKVS